MDYKSKLLKTLRYFEIPESEYSFNGEMQRDYVYVEKVRLPWQKDYLWDCWRTPCLANDAWKVISLDNGEKTLHGIFYEEKKAYIFLFYLVTRKHPDIDIENKRWWLGEGMI